MHWNNCTLHQLYIALTFIITLEFLERFTCSLKRRHLRPWKNLAEVGEHLIYLFGILNLMKKHSVPMTFLYFTFLYIEITYIDFVTIRISCWCIIFNILEFICQDVIFYTNEKFCSLLYIVQSKILITKLIY